MNSAVQCTLHDSYVATERERERHRLVQTDMIRLVPEHNGLHSVASFELVNTKTLKSGDMNQ